MFRQSSLLATAPLLGAGKVVTGDAPSGATAMGKSGSSAADLDRTAEALMRSIGMAGVIVAMMAALLSPGASFGAALNLECNVHWTRPGGHHRDAKRRLDINLGAKTVRTYDDVGKGYAFKSEHSVVSADRDRIVIEAGGGKESYLDRRTGEYYFKNEREDLVIRGPCKKTASAQPAF